MRALLIITNQVESELELELSSFSEISLKF